MPFRDKHPLYHVWQSMRDRCRNPNHRQWKDYGGRGIRVCERWNDFHVWLGDMGPRPAGYVIDRIDNDGNYEPGNCRWTTHRENQLNQRRTWRVTIEGREYRVRDLAVLCGLKPDTIKARAEKGLPMAEVLNRGRRVHYDGLALGGRASGDKRLAATHCKNRHPWSAENTLQGAKQRYCRACAREKAARQRAKKKG
jgi:hypothetical protein